MNKPILLLILVSFLAACGQNASSGAVQQSAETPETARSQPAPVALSSNIDPVCDMEVSAESVADTTLYQGKVYGFCSPDCKEAFLKEPAAYVGKN